MADTEVCSCASTTVIRIHGKGTYCGDAQHERLAEELAVQVALDVDEAGDPNCWPSRGAGAALDALRKEPAPVPDDITLLNQAQASIFRALCAAQAMNPNAGNTPVSAYVRDALRLDGLLAVPAPVVQQPAAEPEPLHVGETIREAIEAIGLTYQKQLALRIGVSEKHLSQLLNGRAPLSTPIALRIEAVTGVSAELLMCLQVRHDVAMLRAAQQPPDATPVKQPAAEPEPEPEPFWLKDIVGDEVGVNSLPGQARISLDVTDVVWLTPDQADQLADALKAHAAARRADEPGGGAQ